MFTKKELLEIVNDINILYRDSLNLPDNVKFGMEIEYAEAERKDIRPLILNEYPEWNELEDITTSINHIIGGEVTSPILHDDKKCWEEIANVLKAMKCLGATSSDTTAAHIHFDSHIISRNLETIFYFLKMWSIFEKEIFQFSFGEYNMIREFASVYAAPIRFNVKNSRKYIEGLLKITNSMELWKVFSNGLGLSHNSSINIDNINDIKDTYEIRIPNGTLSKEIWQNNINFFAKLFLYFNIDYDKEYIDYNFKKMNSRETSLLRYDIKKACELANMIFDNELDCAYFLKQYSRGLIRK